MHFGPHQRNSHVGLWKLGTFLFSCFPSCLTRGTCFYTITALSAFFPRSCLLAERPIGTRLLVLGSRRMALGIILSPQCNTATPMKDFCGNTTGHFVCAPEIETPKENEASGSAILLPLTQRRATHMNDRTVSIGCF